MGLAITNVPPEWSGQGKGCARPFPHPAPRLMLDVQGNILRIRGEKRSRAAQQGLRYHLMERAYGRFERRIPVPHGVNGELAEVAYRDGVLTVILPKTDIVPPR